MRSFYFKQTEIIMKKNNKIITTFALAASLVFPSSSFAAIALSNGELEVRIRSDNGAIDKVSFGGADWYNSGTPVSNWGLQVGKDTTSFRFVRDFKETDTFPRSIIKGGFNLPVTSVTPGANSTSAELDAAYIIDGNAISVNRSYSLLEGVNGLRVETTLTNESLNPLTLRLFDTYDPDPGFDLDRRFDTFMDVGGTDTPEGNALLGHAWINSSTPLSVGMGSTDPRVTIASGGPFGIGSGHLLNQFFAAPFDAEGDLIDSGLHVGFDFTLDPGTSETLIYTQVYGDTPVDNVDDFVKALAASVQSDAPILVEDEGTFVPLPAAFPLFGSALTLIAFLGRFGKSGL